MMQKRKTSTFYKKAAIGLGMVCGVTLGAFAHATDNYPSRTITFIVPYPPGGSTDLAARLIAQKLSESLKQAVIVDNRGGADGIVGMETASRADPNGYTLLFNTAGAQTLAPVLYKTQFDAVDSWEPISMVSAIPFVLVGREGLEAKDIKELIKLAQRPEPPLSASSGSSMITLITDQFKRTIDAPDLLNVPYKGTIMQAQAVIKGEVDISFDSFVTTPYIQSGKLHPFAVSSKERVPAFPDVPTLQELGIEGMDFISWSGLLAPKGTPQPIVDMLSTEVQRIVSLPEVQEKLKTFNHVPVGNGHQEFKQTIADEHARWVQLVKDSNYKIGG